MNIVTQRLQKLGVLQLGVQKLGLPKLVSTGIVSLKSAPGAGRIVGVVNRIRGAKKVSLADVVGWLIGALVAISLSLQGSLSAQQADSIGGLSELSEWEGSASVLPGGLTSPSLPNPRSQSSSALDSNVQYFPPVLFDNPGINATSPPYDPRYDSNFFERRQAFKEDLKDRTGVDLFFAYTPIFQVGEGGNEYIDAELDLGISWNLADDGVNQHNLIAYLLWVHTFSNQPTGAFSQPYGLAIFPNSGATDPNNFTVQLNLLAWERSWCDQAVNLRVGQLRSDFFFAVNKYHNDDRYVFLNTVLSGLQGTNWAATGKGIGAMVNFKGDRFYSSFGFADAKANQTYPDVESFFDGRYHYLSEFGWTPNFGKGSDGAYSATLAYTAETGDPTNVGLRDGYALNLSGWQDFDGCFALAGRWNKSFERYNSNMRESMALSITKTGFYRWKDDWISLGLFYGKPIDRSLDEEHGMEVYWRAPITPGIEITPDFTAYFQRSNQAGPAYFGALRVRMLF